MLKKLFELLILLTASVSVLYGFAFIAVVSCGPSHSEQQFRRNRYEVYEQCTNCDRIITFVIPKGMSAEVGIANNSICPRCECPHGIK